MKKGIITVTPETTDEVFGIICDGFKKKYGEELECIRKDDQSIIGGFIADFDGEVFDTSIKTKLSGLSRHIGRVVL